MTHISNQNLLQDRIANNLSSPLLERIHAAKTGQPLPVKISPPLIADSDLISSPRTITYTDPKSWTKTLQLVDTLATFKQKRSFLRYFLKPIKFLLRLLGLLKKQKFKEEVHIKFLNNILRFSPDSPKGTSLDMLKATLQTFKELKDPNFSSSIKTLKKTLKYAQTLERLKKCKGLTANSAPIKGFSKQLNNDLKQVTKEDPLLLPLSWREDSEQAEGWLKVIKNDTDSYNLQVISMSDQLKAYSPTTQDHHDVTRHSPAFTFENISLQQVQEAIPGLVHIQLPRKEKSKSSGVTGFASTLISVYQRMHQKEDKGGQDQPPQFLTPLHHLQTLFGQEPKPVAEKEFVKSTSQSSFKELLIFFKGHLPEQKFKAQKLKLETQALVHAFKQGNRYLKHPAFRHAVRESVYRLEHEVQKKNAGLEQEQINTLQTSLKAILTRVDAEEKKYAQQGLGKLKRGTWTQQFTMESTDWARERVQNKKSIQTITSPSLEKIDFSSPQSAWDSSSKLIAEVEEIYTAGDWRALEVGLLHLIRQLPPPCKRDFYPARRFRPKELKNFWKGIPVEDCVKWQERFTYLSKLVFEAYRMQELKPAPPDLVIGVSYMQVLINDLSEHMGKEKEGIDLNEDLLFNLITENPYFRTNSPISQTQADILRYCYRNQSAMRIAYSPTPNPDVISPTDKLDYDNPKNPHASRILAAQCFAITRTMLFEGKNLEWYNGALGKLDGYRTLASHFGSDLNELSRKNVRRQYDDAMFSITKRGLTKPCRIKKGKRQITKWTHNKSAGGVQIAPQTYYSHYIDGHRNFHDTGHSNRRLGRTVEQSIDENVIHFKVSRDNTKPSSGLTPSGIELHSTTSREAALRHIQVGDDRLVRTLTLFAQHPEYLEDSSAQRVFELNLLEQNQLFDLIESKPDTFKDICQFVEENLYLAKATGNLSRACFLISCRENLRNFTLHAHVTEIQAQQLLGTLQPYSKTEEELQTLLNQSATLENQQLVVLTLFSILKQRLELGLEPQQLTQTQLKRLVSFQFILQKAPLPTKFANPAAMKEAQMALKMLSGQLQLAMQSLEFRKEVLSHFLPNHTDTSKLKGNYPRYYVKDYLVDVSQGTCFHKNKRQGQLPEEITTTEAVRQAVPNLTSTKATITLSTGANDGKDIFEYQLSDAKKTRIVQKEGHSLLIQCQMPLGKRRRKEMEFITTVEVSTYPSEIALLCENNHLWRSSSNPTELFIYDKSGNQLLYRIDLQRKKEISTIKLIKREADGLRLLPVDLKLNACALKQLGTLDSQGHVLLWGNWLGRLKEVEYPRLRLADGTPLRYRVQGKTITSLNNPQRTLAKENLPLKVALDTHGKTFQIEYLPASFLNSHKWDQSSKPAQVLIPIKPFKVASKINKTEELQVLSWAGTPLVDQDYKKGRCDVAVFELDPINQKLQTKDKRELLFLAYIFLTHKKYDKAVELFRQAETDLLLTPEQLEIYRWIQNWNDPAPEAAVIRLRAEAMLLQRNPPEKRELVLEAALRLKTHYALYQGTKKQLSKPLHLNRKEKDALQEIFDRTGLSLIDLQFSKEKTNASAKVITALQKPNDLSLSALSLELFATVRASGRGDQSLDPDQRLKRGFVALYEHIYQAKSHQLQHLKTEINLMQPATPTGKALRFFLLGLAQLKEANSPELGQLKFPRKCLPCIIHFVRLIQADGNKPRLLEEFFEKLEKAIVAQPLSPALIPATQGGWNMADLDLETATQLFDFSQIDLDHLSAKKIFAITEKQVRAIRKAGLQEYLTHHPAKPFGGFTPLTSFNQSFLASASVPQPAPITRTEQKGNISEFEANQFLCAYSQAFSATNPAAAHMAKELSQDVSVHYQKGTQNSFLLNQQEIKAWIKPCEEDYNAINNTQKEAQAQILLLMGRGENLPQSLKAFYSGSIPHELIALFHRGRIDQVNKQYRLKLSPEDLTRLEQAVATYMRSTVDLQHAKRVLDQTQALAAKKEAVTEEESTELVSLRWTKRTYNPSEHNPLSKALLAIEFMTGYILREKQVEIIQNILNDPVKVLQLGMGEGKSSIILPILLEAFADGTHLAIGLVPDALYQIMSEDLDTNSQELYQFEFHRDSDSSQEELNRIYNDLASCIKNRRILLSTRTFLLSYRNKFIELQQRVKDSDKYPLTPEQRQDIEARLSIMGETLALLKTRGIVIADEIDTILHIRDELNYSTGKLEVLPSEKIDAGLELFSLILDWQTGTDERLKGYAQKILLNEQAGIGTKGIEDLRQSVARELIKKYGLEDSPAMLHYLSGVGEKPNDFDLHFLQPNGIPHFMVKIKQGTPGLYKKLGLMRQFIMAGLKTTLERTGNEDFGRAENHVDICVYAAANTPSKARFGEAFELIPYYIQDYLHSGVKPQQAVDYIDKIISQIQGEMRAKLLEDGHMLAPEATQTYTKFHAEFGLSPVALKQSPQLMEEFRTRLNQTPRSRLEFLKNWILPSVEMAVKQVSSNPIDLVDMFLSFGGFSGTPYNAKTYSKNISIAQAMTPGTDGKSVAVLKKQAKLGEIAIKIIPTEAMRQPIQGLIQHIPDFFKRFQAFADLGGTLKGITNYEAALQFEQEALKRVNRKDPDALCAIGFVDETSNRKMIKEFGKEVQLLAVRHDIEPRKRLFIYDQVHTIGTDVAQDSQARMGVTVGPNTLIKDLFQAIWRMRRLDKGQRIDFIFTEDVAQLIRTACQLGSDVPITIDHILLFALDNQSKLIANDTESSERQRMLALAHYTMVKHLVVACSDPNRADPNVRERLYALYEKHLLKLLGDNYDGFARVNAIDETPKVLARYKADLVDRFKDLAQEMAHQNIPPYFQETFELSIKCLEAYVIAPAKDLPKDSQYASQENEGSQVEIQQQQQQEISLETQRSSIKNTGEWSHWFQGGYGAISDRDKNQVRSFINQVQGLPSLAPDISAQIKFSPNLARTVAEVEKNTAHPPLHTFALFVGPGNQLQGVFLDQNDYAQYLAQARKSGSDLFAVFDLTADRKAVILRSSAISNSNPWNQRSQVEKQRMLQLLAQAKVMAGHFHFYDPDEKAALEAWIKPHPNKRALARYIEESCIPPGKLGEYRQSRLHQFLST